jgi:hypothetical protein
VRVFDLDVWLARRTRLVVVRGDRGGTGQSIVRVRTIAEVLARELACSAQQSLCQETVQDTTAEESMNKGLDLTHQYAASPDFHRTGQDRPLVLARAAPVPRLYMYHICLGATTSRPCGSSLYDKDRPGVILPSYAPLPGSPPSCLLLIPQTSH